MKVHNFDTEGANALELQIDGKPFLRVTHDANNGLCTELIGDSITFGNAGL